MRKASLLFAVSLVLLVVVLVFGTKIVAAQPPPPSLIGPANGATIVMPTFT